MTRLAPVLVLGFAVCTPAFAQGDSAAPPSRYSFNRVDDGFIRLDNGTGQVAHCTQRAVGWACETMPEDRKAFENEITRLTEENAALKAQVTALKRLSPPPRPPEGVSPQASDQPKTSEPPRPPASVPAQASDQLNVPGGHNVDRVMAFVGSTWRRVVEMISGWQKDVMHKG